jgi:hypothetical protein
VPSKDQSCSETRERRASIILEQGLRTIWINRGIGDVLLQQATRLGPERTDPFLAALAEELDAAGRGQPEVGCLQSNDFLHTCSCIEHECEQHIVASSADGAPVNLVENGAYLFGVQIVDGAVNRAFELNRQDPACLIQMLGPAGTEVIEKAVGGAQGLRSASRRWRWWFLTSPGWREIVTAAGAFLAGFYKRALP